MRKRQQETIETIFTRLVSSGDSNGSISHTTYSQLMSLLLVDSPEIILDAYWKSLGLTNATEGLSKRSVAHKSICIL
jgi:hypothetical protein